MSRWCSPWLTARKAQPRRLHKLASPSARSTARRSSCKRALPRSDFFPENPPPLTARLPSELRVNPELRRLAVLASGLVAWGGVSVAYRAGFSAQAARNRACHRRHRSFSAGAESCFSRGAVRLLLQRRKAAGALRPVPAGDVLRRSRNRVAASRRAAASGGRELRAR